MSFKGLETLPLSVKFFSPLNFFSIKNTQKQKEKYNKPPLPHFNNYKVMTNLILSILPHPDFHLLYQIILEQIQDLS